MYNTVISHQLYILQKIVCTVPFNSRWWVYWYKFFSVLSLSQKWQNFDELSSLIIIRGFSSILGNFKQDKILISLECAFGSEWNGVIIFVVPCLVAKLFICWDHEKFCLYWPTTTTLLSITDIIKFACVVVLEVFCNWLEKVLKHIRLFLCLKR